MTVREKLANVQAKLKAPKGNFNSFGGYSYRSAEDILEAVKPIAHAEKAIVVVGDKVVRVGGANYVKAGALFMDTESEDFIEITAYAREQETKKGMDTAQITGSTSSYARKYALSGLLAIDDTKDPDTNEQKREATGRSASAVATTLPKAKRELMELFKTKGYNNSAIIRFIEKTLGKDSIDSLTDIEQMKAALNG